MKRVMIFLDEETGRKLTDLSKRERRSVKAMTEKIVIDNIEKRSDGYTDARYMELKEAVQ